MEVVVITIDLLIAQTTILAVVDHLIIVVIVVIVVVAVVVAIVVVGETTIDLLLLHRPHLRPLPLLRSVQHRLCYPIHVDHLHENPPLPNGNIANITAKSLLPPDVIIIHHRENVVKNINTIVAVLIMMTMDYRLYHHILHLLYLLTVNANTMVIAVVTVDILPLDVPHPHVKIVPTIIIITNRHLIVITIIQPIKMIMMAKTKKILNDTENPLQT